MAESAFLVGETPTGTFYEFNPVTQLLASVYSVRKIQKSSIQQKTIRLYQSMISSPHITVHSEQLTDIIKHLMRIHLNPCTTTLRDAASSALQQICLIYCLDVPRDGRLFDDTNPPVLSSDNKDRSNRSTSSTHRNSVQPLNPSPLAVASTSPTPDDEDDSEEQAQPQTEQCEPIVITPGFLLTTHPNTPAPQPSSLPDERRGKLLMSDCLALIKKLCSLSTFDPERFAEVFHSVSQYTVLFSEFTLSSIRNPFCSLSALLLFLPPASFFSHQSLHCC